MTFVLKNKNLENRYTERWFSPIDRTLRRELKSSFGKGEFWFDTTSYKELIDLRIKAVNKNLIICQILKFKGRKNTTIC